METRLLGLKKEVIIGDQQPTVLIGERINPTGRKELAEALADGDLEIVRKEALAQVKAGADVLDVNVGVAGLDEVDLLPRAVKVIMDTVDIPLCLDSSSPKALEAALKVCPGKPLINSVTAEERSLEMVLPLVKEYKAAVIGLTMDDEGIPNDSDKRLLVASKIVARAEAMGIPPEDIIIDCLAQTVGVDTGAGLVTIEAIRKIKVKLGVNMTLGASNISFGLPTRSLLNNVFLAIAIASGVNCPIVDVAWVRQAVLAGDLILGRDSYAMRYLKGYRSARGLSRQERGGFSSD